MHPWLQYILIALIIVVLFQTFRILQLQFQVREIKMRLDELLSKGDTTRARPHVELMSERVIGKSTDPTELEVKKS